MQRLRQLAGVESSAHARRRFQRWCVATTQRLGLRVRVEGRASAVPCVYVANHRSYLDIPLLGGALGAAFLSRADVAAWPLVGSAARAIGTVFIDRDEPASRAAAARGLARRLRECGVVVFAEGTTGGAPLPAPFFAGLFRLLQRIGVPVVPVTIRYSDRRAYWLDARGIAAHLRGVLAARGLDAAVHIGAAIDPAASRDAAALGAAVHAAVSAPIHAHGELASVAARRLRPPRRVRRD